MSRLRRSNKAEQTRRGGRARAFRLLPGIYDAQRLRAGLKYVAPPALERGRTDTARREGTGVPAAAWNLRCRVAHPCGFRTSAPSRCCCGM